jgi:hypothetical protein
MHFRTLFVLAAAAATALAADEKPLFTGSDLKGWKTPHGTWQAVKSVTVDPANAKAFRAEAGTGVLLNSASDHTSDLFTEADHGDCELHVEFCVPKDSNSGVYLQGRYEVQILDSFGKKELNYGDCGGLYERPEKGVGFQGKPPAVNASKAPGEWQSFDITFRAPRFGADGKKTENARFVKVMHNGKVIHENVEVDGPTRSAAFQEEKALGPLKLQGDHGPIAFRNLRLKPL